MPENDVHRTALQASAAYTMTDPPATSRMAPLPIETLESLRSALAKLPPPKSET